MHDSLYTKNAGNGLLLSICLSHRHGMQVQFWKRWHGKMYDSLYRGCWRRPLSVYLFDWLS